jgi:hypothetical protein
MDLRWRLAVVAALSLLTGLPSSAYAQTGGYVSGILFADLQRGSGETSTSIGSVGVPKIDGTAIGGGVRGGVFLAPQLTLELGVDLGGPVDHTTTPQILPLKTPPLNSLTGAAFPGYVVPQFEDQVRTRTTATSVLIAYHPPAHRRLRAGFAGGVSFVRTSTTTTDTVRYVLVGNFIVPPPIVAPMTTTTEAVSNQMAATVAGELAIELSRRAFVVPEVRAHGFDNRLVLRPGVAFRWQW